MKINCFRVLQIPDSELSAQIIELIYTGDLIDPCDKNRTPEEMINDALSTACDPSVTDNAMVFKETLANEDYIRIDESVKNNPLSEVYSQPARNERCLNVFRLQTHILDAKRYNMRSSIK